jgi:S1-C subfamily serine protease
MKYLVLALMIVGTFVGCTPPKQCIINRVLSSCVYIEALDIYGNRMWSGSGVIAKGRIITAAHVLDGANALRILDIEGNEVEYDSYYHSDENDFGFIIPVDSNLPSVEIVDSNSLTYGDTVYVIGASLGLENFPTVTCGIVSGLDRRHEFFGDDFQLQVDAQSWPGNSGGPVFNKRGQVIGILIGGIWGSDGFSIVTPSEVILNDWYLSALYKKEMLCQK